MARSVWSEMDVSAEVWPDPGVRRLVRREMRRKLEELTPVGRIVWRVWRVSVPEQRIQVLAFAGPWRVERGLWERAKRRGVLVA